MVRTRAAIILVSAMALLGTSFLGTDTASAAVTKPYKVTVNDATVTIAVTWTASGNSNRVSSMYIDSVTNDRISVAFRKAGVGATPNKTAGTFIEKRVPVNMVFTKNLSFLYVQINRVYANRSCTTIVKFNHGAFSTVSSRCISII
jgi:hypothetical protein